MEGEGIRRDESWYSRLEITDYDGDKIEAKVVAGIGNTRYFNISVICDNEYGAVVLTTTQLEAFTKHLRWLLAKRRREDMTRRTLSNVPAEEIDL